MVTQKIDKDDDILGVYHEWAKEIAKSFDKLSVICLFEGVNDLPDSIPVFSLGKEDGNFQFPIFNFQSIPNFPIFKKLQYTLRFYKYIWDERENYDVVFVHMNPVYVILGWPLWKALGKRIFLWFAHPAWNWKVRLAYALSDRVITSVPEAFYAKGKKVIAIGQGIDTDVFCRDLRVERGENSLLSLGRLSPAKKVEVLIGAVSRLDVPYNLSIVGGPTPVKGVQEYAEGLKALVEKLGLARAVQFWGRVPYKETTLWFRRSEIFINLSSTGYFDKTVIEAMACECVVVVCNDAYRHIFPEDLHDLLIFQAGNPDDLAMKLRRILLLSDQEKERIGKRLREDERRAIGRTLRGIVVRDHSLSTLGKRLHAAFSSNQ